MDPNYKEDEEGGGASNTGSSSSGQVKLDATKAKEPPKKSGFC